MSRITNHEQMHRLSVALNAYPATCFATKGAIKPALRFVDEGETIRRIFKQPIFPRHFLVEINSTDEFRPAKTPPVTAQLFAPPIFRNCNKKTKHKDTASPPNGCACKIPCCFVQIDPMPEERVQFLIIKTPHIPDKPDNATSPRKICHNEYWRSIIASSLLSLIINGQPLDAVRSHRIDQCILCTAGGKQLRERPTLRIHRKVVPLQ